MYQSNYWDNYLKRLKTVIIQYNNSISKYIVSPPPKKKIIICLNSYSMLMGNSLSLAFWFVIFRKQIMNEAILMYWCFFFKTLLLSRFLNVDKIWVSLNQLTFAVNLILMTSNFTFRIPRFASCWNGNYLSLP